MRFEKRMLILSGKGKGIVMIERSGAGVKFSLKTFEFEARADLKAGIVTPSKVMIRDLPSTRDPSATFYTDDLELDRLHFALFDSEILLYGACGERMWESNLIDILARHDHSKPKVPPTPISRAEYTALPQSPAAKSLPSPSVPAANYGDESVAPDDFYTPFDFSARLDEVDAFLDTPRVLNEPSILDGLAPRITPHSAADADAAATADDIEQVSATDLNDRNAVEEMREERGTQDGEEAQNVEAVDGNTEIETENAEMNVAETTENDAEITQERSGGEDGKGNFVITDNISDETGSAETSASVDVDVEIEQEPARLPWELESKWLSSRGGRKVVKNTPKVAKVKQQTDVQRLRDSMFIERCRADIDKLFGAAQKDEELCKLLPDIDWIRAELGSGTISVGRGGDSFLCYAVGGTYSRENPFGDDAQWLPSRRAEPSGQGYWLIFQSLKTGEIIKTE